jgi:putative lipoic acid-binding regulatory protein
MALEEDKRPEIEYPCEWAYKIIGTNIEKILEAIENAVSGMKYDVTPSNISKKGKYFSLNLLVTVPNETMRDIVYKKLSDNDFIKIVL